MAKTGLFLVNRIIIRQIPSLCDCDKHKRVERYATTCRKAESDNYLLKISGSSRFRRIPGTKAVLTEGYNATATVIANTEVPVE